MINAYGSTASVETNSNKVYGTTKARWKLVQEGSLLRIGNDHTFYNVQDTEETFYIKEFYKVSPDTIEVHDNVKYNIVPDDLVTISYKEHEIASFDVEHAGQGFKVNDVFSVEDGLPNFRKFDGEPELATFVVKKVNKKGGIISLDLLEYGVYIEKPPLTFKVESPTGEDAEIKLQFRERNNRPIVEANVLAVKRRPANSIIKFDGPLPDFLQAGKVATKKHALILNSSYFGEPKYLADFEVVTSFTPYLKLPLLVKNSLSPEVFYNKALLELDRRIQELEAKVKALTKN
jgi:hypothetical protein